MVVNGASVVNQDLSGGDSIGPNRPAQVFQSTAGDRSSATYWNSPSALLVGFDTYLSEDDVKSLTANPWQIYEPEVSRIWVDDGASVSLPTLVQPSSTTTTGAWTATGAASLHAAINELVASDTQYISVNSASTTELLLAEAAYPGAANQTLAYRASSTQGSTLTVTLKQGVTTIMTRTHALTGTDTLYTQTLTAPEIALITAGAISVTLTTS